MALWSHARLVVAVVEDPPPHLRRTRQHKHSCNYCTCAYIILYTIKSVARPFRWTLVSYFLLALFGFLFSALWPFLTQCFLGGEESVRSFHLSPVLALWGAGLADPCGYCLLEDLDHRLKCVTAGCVNLNSFASNFAQCVLKPVFHSCCKYWICWCMKKKSMRMVYFSAVWGVGKGFLGRNNFVSRPMNDFGKRSVLPLLTQVKWFNSWFSRAKVNTSKSYKKNSTFDVQSDTVEMCALHLGEVLF